MFTLDDLQCYDPRQLRRELGGQLSTSETWWGLANCFSNPLGCKPGTGGLLMRKGDIDTLFPGQNLDDFLTLRIFDHDNELIFPRIVISGPMICLTPSSGNESAIGQFISNDDNQIYLVPIADVRWLHYKRGDTVSVAYNVRNPKDPQYFSGTLNGVDPWTWQQIVDDLWPASLDMAPDLPFSPDGTPENFWYHGISRFEALEHLLTRLGCALKYHPIDNEFSIVRLGDSAEQSAQDAPGVLNAWTVNGYLLDIAKPVATRTSILPETVKVEFVVKRPFCNGRAPFTTKEVTVNPAAGPLAAGTVVVLQDDLTAICTDGENIDNDDYLNARTTERVADFIRKRRYYDTDKRLIFSGGLDLISCLGAYYETIVWHDTGGSSTRLDGLKTEIRSGTLYGDQFDLVAWRRPMPTYEGLDVEECLDSGTGTGSGTGSASGSASGLGCHYRECIPFVESVYCDPATNTLKSVVKYLVGGPFQVCDHPPANCISSGS